MRDIAARMLETPAPPMRDADEMLSVARRASRRRAWTGAVRAGSVALVLALAVIGLVRPTVSGEPPRPSDQDVAGSAAPMARAAPAHGQHMTEVLLAALPAGYTTAPPELFSDSDVVLTAPATPGRAQILAASVLRVFAGTGEGELYAFLVHDGRLAPDDVCAEPAGAPDKCTVHTIGGVAVRVVTVTDATRGQKIEATRFLAGGRLVVGSWQGPPGERAQYPASLWEPDGQFTWWRPPLTEPLLDITAVAALAADPAMLPA